jgi:uncharacterized protein YaiI (UPF0178 family)
MTNDSRRVFVDADACPVKDEIKEISKQHRIDVFFVASYAHVSINNDQRQWIYVDSRREEVDMYIVNHAREYDIVVTQDHGLASLLLGADVYVLSPRGKHFVENEMPRILHERFLSAKQRRSGKHTKGPGKMTKEDRQRFCESFKKILSINEGKQ